MFLVDFAPLFFEQARYHIAGIYDGGEEAHGFGPFSYKEYLMHILGHHEWGDNFLCGVIAHMWKQRVTVNIADTLAEIRYFHTAPLEKADIVLVHVGGCHYLGAGKLCCNRQLQWGFGISHVVGGTSRKIVFLSSISKVRNCCRWRVFVCRNFLLLRRRL